MMKFYRVWSVTPRETQESRPGGGTYTRHDLVPNQPISCYFLEKADAETFKSDCEIPCIIQEDRLRIQSTNKAERVEMVEKLLYASDEDFVLFKMFWGDRS